MFQAMTKVSIAQITIMGVTNLILYLEQMIDQLKYGIIKIRTVFRHWKVLLHTLTNDIAISSEFQDYHIVNSYLNTIFSGHTQNISAVTFHPELPIILTGSEDGTVRVWHANTYRLENTLNYGLERVWQLSSMKGKTSTNAQTVFRVSIYQYFN